MAQARDDETAHKGRIPEADLGLGGVDVYVNFLRRQVKKQRQHGMAIARQHISIGPAHRADQKPVLHRTAVDEQVLVIGHTPVEGRQTGHAGQPHRAALQVDHHPVLGQFARDQLGNASRERLPALHRQHAAAIVFEREAHFGPGHGKAAHNIEASSVFAAWRAEELAPRRDLAEQVLDPDARARWQGGGTVSHLLAVVDNLLPSAIGPAHPAFHGKTGNAGD